ncbi:MAG: hypothetical protein KDJ80_03745 [Nitratireductor sp.]|nr:hypothetical protein [Nitratireductor sp.]
MAYGKYSSMTACLIAGSLVAGCAYPTRVNPEDKTIHIDYEKIQNSLICRLIEAWKIEREYHERRLNEGDGTNWLTEITITHTRTGAAGLGSGMKATKVLTQHNWTRTIPATLTPSDSNSYEVKSNIKVNIPRGLFENYAKSRNNLDLKFKEDYKNLCVNENYLDIRHLGIVSQFENFIKGFEKEHHGKDAKPRRYTNLNYSGTAKLSASLDPSFKFSLVPYEFLLPLQAKYEDKIDVVVKVTREDLYEKPEKEKVSKKAGRSARETAERSQGIVPDTYKQRNQDLLEERVMELIDENAN